MEFNQGLLGEWMMEWGEINKPNEVLLKSNMVEKIGFYHTFAAGTLGMCNMLIHISLFFGLLSGIPMALKMISLCSCYPQERLDPFRFSPLCFKTMYSGKKFIFLKFWSVHIFMQFKNSKRFFFLERISIPETEFQKSPKSFPKSVFWLLIYSPVSLTSSPFSTTCLCSFNTSIFLLSFSFHFYKMHSLPCWLPKLHQSNALLSLCILTLLT